MSRPGGHATPRLYKRSYSRTLTALESETLRLCAQGMRYQEIATLHNVQYTTVIGRMNRIKARMGVNSKLEAVLMWMASGRW